MKNDHFGSISFTEEDLRPHYSEQLKRVLNMIPKQEKKHLSYSGYSTYMTCPKKYDYHYNEKLRPIAQHFHLIFGSATDKALNCVLEELKKCSLEFDCEDFSVIKRLALQDAATELYRVLREKVSLEPKDFDGEILTNHLRTNILMKKLNKVGWNGSDPAALGAGLFQEISFGKELSKNQKKALKYLVIASSLEKISLIIDSFFDYVVPQIEEIVSVQTNVKRGILDFEARLKGVEGLVICDNKTSARPYEENAVINSVQLAGYGAKYGAYIVFNKTVKKNRTKDCGECGNVGTGTRFKTCNAEVDGVRCGGEWVESVTPEIEPQILIDEVPEHNRVMVEEAYAQTEALIEAKVFPRNLNNCGKQFGSPCSHINLCWKNDKSGLKKE